MVPPDKDGLFPSHTTSREGTLAKKPRFSVSCAPVGAVGCPGLKTMPIAQGWDRESFMKIRNESEKERWQNFCREEWRKSKFLFKIKFLNEKNSR
jgi:hypothetical protein